MIMKQYVYIIAFLLGGTLLLAGCQKDGNGLSRSGEIRFSASSHAYLPTRTHYGADPAYDNTLKHQDILWEESDEIRVYSPTATRRIGTEAGSSSLYHWADYQIVPDASDPTKATIRNLEHDGGSSGGQAGSGNGLAWDRGEENITHKFYAVTPNTRSNAGVPDDEGTGASINGANGRLDLYIPSSQGFSTAGHLDAYGWLTAFGQGSANSSDPITLDFYPAFTTFEISIRSEDAAITASRFSLNAAADAPALAGMYAAVYDDSGNRTFDFSGASDRSISVNLGGNPVPAASSGTDLVFSVLALPQTTLTGLSVSFTFGEITRTLALTRNGSPIAFTGGRKHRIYGLLLSNDKLLVSVDVAPWVEGTTSDFVTGSNVQVGFNSYQRYNGMAGENNWSVPNYVAVAPGRNTVNHTNPDDPSSPLTNLPLRSVLMNLNNHSNVDLVLRSDNPLVGFIVRDASGVWPLTVSSTLTIPASTTDNAFNFAVMPVDGCPPGTTANISLVRTDNNAPVAFTHKDMPGSTDHTRIPFIVLSESDYDDNTYTSIAF